MSCVTCETTPPEEKTAPEPVGHHHIGERFGTYGLGWAVIYRGRDVTLQCVEALAGDEDTGWVEMRIVNLDGEPTIHAGADWTCSGCGAPRQAPETVDGWPDPDSTDVTRWPTCDCGDVDRPTRAYEPHVVTVIRRGMVQIAKGATLITGPPASEPCPMCGLPMHWMTDPGVWGCSHCIDGEIIDPRLPTS